MLLNIESKKKYFGLNENENNVWDLAKENREKFECFFRRQIRMQVYNLNFTFQNQKRKSKVTQTIDTLYFILYNPKYKDLICKDKSKTQ